MPKKKKSEEVAGAGAGGKLSKWSAVGKAASQLAKRAALQAKLLHRMGGWSSADESIQAAIVSLRASSAAAREHLVQAAAAGQKLVDAGFSAKGGKVGLVPGAAVAIKDKFAAAYAPALQGDDAKQLQVAHIQGGRAYVRIGGEGSQRFLGFVPRGQLSLTAQ